MRGEAAHARQLRVNSTDAERKLWSLLRNRQIGGWKFVRQFPIGAYIVDFACREAALVIEVDGGQHNGSTADNVRTGVLNAEGYSLLRFWNNEVLGNPEGVFDTIGLVIAGTPSPEWRYSPAAFRPGRRAAKGVAAATSKTPRRQVFASSEKA